MSSREKKEIQDLPCLGTKKYRKYGVLGGKIWSRFGLLVGERGLRNFETQKLTVVLVEIKAILVKMTEIPYFLASRVLKSVSKITKAMVIS